MLLTWVVSLRIVLLLYFSLWLKIFIIESWNIEMRVMTSFTLGGRLSKSLGILDFHRSLFTYCKKERCLCQSTLPTADPELSIFINGWILLSPFFPFLKSTTLAKTNLKPSSSLQMLWNCRVRWFCIPCQSENKSSCGWWNGQQHAERVGGYLQCHATFKALFGL